MSLYFKSEEDTMKNLILQHLVQHFSSPPRLRKDIYQIIEGLQ